LETIEHGRTGFCFSNVVFEVSPDRLERYFVKKNNEYVDMTVEALSKEVQLYVFRLAQELLNNWLKHPQATEYIARVKNTSGRRS